jgi:hypothetical protein
MNLIFRRLWIQLTADKRRFRALVTVMAVGMVLWAKPMGLFIWTRLRMVTSIPRTAMADEEAVLQAPSPTAQPPRVQSITLDTLAVRDPFLVSEALFPKPTIATENDDQEEKSRPASADDPEEAERRLTNRLRDLASTLRLEALMSGLPLAVINGVTVRVGESIIPDESESAEFRLIEIRSRSVILESQGRLFELEMSTSLTPTR